MYLRIVRPRVLFLALATAATAALACRAPGMSASRDMSPAGGLAWLQALDAGTRGVPERARGPILGAAYDDAFAGLVVDRITDDELAAWYRAAQIAAFYTHDPRRARAMGGLLGALEQRGRARERNYAEVYETYVGARLLDDARALALRHALPSAEVLPHVRELEPMLAGIPSEWVVDPSGRELVHRRVALDENSHFVIISHPDCHFSQRAVADLEQEPDLRAALAAHGTWLAPQANHLDVEAIGEWNRRHPGLEIGLAVRRDDWPMIDSWGTPTFYVLEHGAVVAKVEGWPAEGRRDELRAAMRRSGLLP